MDNAYLEAVKSLAEEKAGCELKFDHTFPSQSFGRDIKQIFRWHLPNGTQYQTFAWGDPCDDAERNYLRFNHPDFCSYLQEVYGDRQLSEGELLQAREDYEKVQR